MRKFFFYFFWGAASVLMIAGATHEEYQFAAIMCGIFAMISK